MLNDHTPESRLATHNAYAARIVAKIAELQALLIEAALRVQDEIEDLHARIEDLEAMHYDPAAHGRALKDHGSGGHPNIDLDQ